MCVCKRVHFLQSVFMEFTAMVITAAANGNLTALQKHTQNISLAGSNATKLCRARHFLLTPWLNPRSATAVFYIMTINERAFPRHR